MSVRGKKFLFYEIAGFLINDQRENTKDACHADYDTQKITKKDLVPFYGAE